MAGVTLGQAWMYLMGDSSNLENSLDGAEKKTSSFASKATNLIGGAVAGAAVAAGAAIIGIGTAAFNVSVDTASAAADMAASLGVLPEEAEKFADVAKRVYGNNFADSVGDAADAVTEVAKQMKLAAEDPALKTMTENALRLRDTFGVDVNESVSAVKTLMENFGISGDEAFDMLAAGYQKGLDRSGDFIDSIGEYSTQFASGGASASEFFSLMESGAQGGMLGTDKAADAFKEFRIRISEGTGEVATWLDTMEGIVDSGVISQIKAGNMDVADAFELVLQGINAIEDPIERHKAGVALMGTQWEDLGEDMVANMTLTGDWATTSVGAINSLDAKYATFGSAVDGMWRRLVVSVSPFTDKLLELVNSAMPKVMAAFDVFDANIGPIMDGIGTSITTVVNFVVPLFGSLGSSVNEASGPLKYLKEWVDTNLPLLQKIFETVLGAIQGFWDLFGEDILHVVNNTFTVISTVIGTTLATIGDTITLFLQLITGDWEGAWETFKGIFERYWETIKTVVSTQLDSLRTIFSNIDWGEVGKTLLNAVLAGIKLIWVDLDNWIREALNGLWASVTGVDWAGAGTSLVNSTKAGAESAWSNLSTWFKSSSEGLLNYWNTTTWEQKGKDAIGAIQKGGEAVYSTYKTSLSTLIDGVLGFFTGEDWSGTGAKLINDIETGIANVWNDFTAYVGGLATSLGGLFFQLDLSNAGEAIVEAIKTGINNKWQEFTDWFKLKLGELTSLLPFSEPKNASSPLRNLSKSGKSFVANWWDGAAAEFGSLKANLSGALGNLAGGLGNIPNGSQLGMAGGGINITVNVSGNNATYETGRAVGRGVSDELRKRGA